MKKMVHEVWIHSPYKGAMPLVYRDIEELNFHDADGSVWFKVGDVECWFPSHSIHGIFTKEQEAKEDEKV